MAGRPKQVTKGEILDAALAILARGGVEAVTTRAVCAQLGISNGSLFHAFRTRDHLLTALWVRTVERFQEDFLADLGRGPPDEAIPRAAVRVLDFARRSPAEAALLTRFRRRDVARDRRLGRGALRAGRQLDAAIDAVAARLSKGDLARARRVVVFAAVQVPYGVVATSLAEGGTVAEDLDLFVREAARAALATAGGGPRRGRARR